VWTCIIRPEHLLDGDNAKDATPQQKAAAASPQLQQVN
jgi:hypothetical protein